MKSITLSQQSIADIQNHLAEIYYHISIINDTLALNPPVPPSFVSEILNHPNDHIPS